MIINFIDPNKPTLTFGPSTGFKFKGACAFIEDGRKWIEIAHQTETGSWRILDGFFKDDCYRHCEVRL